MKKVLVIIVTYNPMRWIDRCLSTLRQSTVPLSVMVVDNHSTDGAAEHIPTMYPEVIWRPQAQNLGFGQGNNVGMRYAIEEGFDYALLLNQDAYLQPDALEHLLAVADDKNLFSPIHMSGDGSRIDNNFRESLKKGSNQLIDDLLLGTLKPSYETGEVCAACWLMPVQMLKEIGGFNPLFFQYGEDNNYYTRLVYHGRKVIIVPDARVWHDRKTAHGNESLYRSRRVHIRVLTTACNPGLSLFKKCYWWFDSILMDPTQTLSALSGLLKQVGRIRKSLRKERTIGSHWL